MNRRENYNPQDDIENQETNEAINAAGRIESGEIYQARDKAKRTREYAKKEINGANNRLFGIDGSLSRLQTPPLSEKQELQKGIELSNIDQDNPEIDPTAKDREKNETRKTAARLGVIEGTDDKTLGANVAKVANEVGGEGANTQAARTEIRRDYTDDPDNGVSEATA